jgi:predicted membrane protein
MKRKTIMGILFILAGLVIFTVRINEFNFSTLLHRYWPAVIILIGILILFSGEGKGIKLTHDKDGGDEYIDYMNIFSGLTTVNESKDFRGGAITAIFGAAEVDLRPATINPERCEMSLTALFGGVEVRLPENCNVIITGIPIFGGWENKKLPTKDPNLPVVKIKCFVAFGGIEVS